MRGDSFSRQCGEKGRQRGPWPRHQGQQTRPRGKRTVETSSDTNRCHPPGRRCGAGSRLDRAQEARRPRNSYQPHPPWPAQRTRDRPRSLWTDIRRGRRERQQFPRPTLLSPTSEQARFKKNKTKKIPSPNCAAAAPEREQRSILHPPPPPSSPPPAPPPPNAQWQVAEPAVAAATAAAEAEAAAAASPAPRAAVRAEEAGTQAPPPGQRRPMGLKGS